MSLSPFPGPIAVIDVETTGLFPYRHDRVVEIAVVVIQGDGRIEREFVSLVNPGRDIGPTSIHGLTSADILHAPQFGDIAGMLIDALSGTLAIAAHNMRFDQQFLEYEFTRIGVALPECLRICTMQLAGGGKLSKCCSDYDIPFEGEAHNALADARATARLLATLLGDQARIDGALAEMKPIQWPNVPRTLKQPISRNESRHRQNEQPTFLQRLLGRTQESALAIALDGAVMAYAALLDRVLEDRRVDDTEAEALIETASRWGLSSEQIRLAHRDYLNQLALAAVADGIVTDAERRDLKLVARLLGHDQPNLDEMLNNAAVLVAKSPPISQPLPVADSSLKGKRVCFTGEMQCVHQGRRISREGSAELATNAGLEVVESVNKKLHLLVVTDPHTQSGKAKKAQQYGIRIIHEPLFWKAIGVEVA